MGNEYIKAIKENLQEVENELSNTTQCLEICKKIISKYGNEKNKQYKTLKHEYDELESSLLILLVVKKLVSEKLYIAELEDKRLIKGRNKRNI